MYKSFTILLLFVFFSASVSLFAQQDYSISPFYVLPMRIVDGDTVYIAFIREVIIFPKRVFSNPKDYARYQRLVRDLKIVYPYARLANEILCEMNQVFISLPNENEKKQYINLVEKRLKGEFEVELKNLTIRQGKLLIKLIDRETGSSTFELVKEMKGSFSAFFWQTLAKLFGSDLKVKYDPFGEDRLIEEILILIENGQL